MLVYLDTCSLQRPLDSKSQARIHLEAEAVLAVLGLCETGHIRLVSSEVLFFEISRTPDAFRRAYALKVLSNVGVHIDTSDQVVERARIYQSSGVSPLDALHLASSVQGEADFFCTCDDRLLRRARSTETLRTKVVSPLELVQEIDEWRSS